MTERIRDLRGLGPKSEQMLIDAGVSDVATLKALGAVRAYLKVYGASHTQGNLNLLWAIEGALNDRDWRDIARSERGRLLLELDSAREATTRFPTSIWD